MKLKNPEGVYQFEGFVLDLTRGLLLTSDGENVPLRRKSFHLLGIFVANAGKLIDRDTLNQAIWSGVVVTDDGITQCVRDVRCAVRDATHRMLKTVPRRGYIFTSEVTSTLDAQNTDRTGIPSRPSIAVAPFENLGSNPDRAYLADGVAAAAAAAASAAAAMKKPAPQRAVDEVEALPLPDKPSIVVLPFKNVSNDPEQEYFVDGIVDDITTAISRFDTLFVIARNSAFTYKGRAVDTREIGRQLGVRYAVEGSVRKVDRHIRIACQLIRAEDGVHLWAEHYDRDLGDIFALQDEITSSIISILVPTIQRVEIERARRKPLNNLDGYDVYLRALAAHRKYTQGGNEEARALIDQTLVLDPDFVPALVLGNACWATAMTNGWMPQAEALERCTRYAKQAIDLAPDNADALSSLAQRTAAINGDYEDAVSLASRAVAANPNSVLVLQRCGYALLYAYQLEEALAHFQKALRLSPKDPSAFGTWTGIGFTLILLGRDVEAIDAGKKSVRLNPVSADAFRVLAASLALAGRLDDAKVAVHRMLELDPGCTISGIRARYGITDDRRTLHGFRRAGVPE